MPEQIATASFESPLGPLRLAATPTGLIRVALPRGGGSGFGGWLTRTFPDAERVDWLPLLDKAEQELGEYFAGRRRDFTVALEMHGTAFQKRVWDALCDIPYGETRSYGDVAKAISNKGASRAVGLANGANPLAIIVPCHRVIASGGKLGGYGGGLDAKRRLLALEGTATFDSLA